MGLKDRRNIKVHIKSVRLLVRAVETEFNRRTRNLTIDSAPNEEALSYVRTNVAMAVWGKATQMSGRQDFPGRQPITVAGHAFLLLTARGVFRPDQFGVLAYQYEWLGRLGITKAHMSIIWENPKVIDFGPNSFSSLIREY
jgi:hypothetical protein